jgi:antitoxin VapB
MTYGPEGPAPIDVEKVWAKLAAMGAACFLPEGILDDPPAEPDPTVCFDD